MNDEEEKTPRMQRLLENLDVMSKNLANESRESRARMQHERVAEAEMFDALAKVLASCIDVVCSKVPHQTWRGLKVLTIQDRQLYIDESLEWREIRSGQAMWPADVVNSLDLAEIWDAGEVALALATALTAQRNGLSKQAPQIERYIRKYEAVATLLKG